MTDHAQSRSMQPPAVSGGFLGFLQRRLAEAGGGALIILGLALLLALLTASSGDPSFNRAVDQPTKNLMGPLGAYVADFALQGVGLGVIALVAAPLAWGWRLIRDRALPRWWLRLALVPVAALLLSLAAAGLPSSGPVATAKPAAGKAADATSSGTVITVTPAPWPWTAGYGGFAGHLLLSGSAGLNSDAPDDQAAARTSQTGAGQGTDRPGGVAGLLLALGVPPILGSALALPALIGLALALVTLYFALGIGIHSYLRFGRNVANAGRQVGLVIERGRRNLAPGGREAGNGEMGNRYADNRDDDPMDGADVPQHQPPRGGWRHRLVAAGRALLGGEGNVPHREEPHFVEEDAGERAYRRGQHLAGAPAIEPDYEPAMQPSLSQPSARTRALVAAPAPREKAPAKAAKRGTVQPSLALEEGDFELPPHDLLARPAANAAVQKINEESLEKNARLLETVLEDFGVKGEIVKVRPGPVVTLYELEPAPGTKTSRVVSLADDVARSMSAVSVRIAVVPGRSVIGIELPNRQRETVALRELLEDDSYQSTQAKLALVLGKDIGGAPIVVDLARMPHLLIAGTTGSGKSVAINTMILSLLYRLTPDQCKFIMIDPKMLELSVYDGIPHLLSPVVTEPRKAVVALKWVVREMENRYRSMSKLGVRNIDGYNQRLEQARKAGEELTRRVQTGFDPETGKPIYEEEPFDLNPLPFIVVVVDEMADLMLVAGKDIEAAIQRLAQMARAAGIHIVMATQRPSVDVITGTIKANFPTRVSFHVTTKIDSRTILGETGAEQLLGQGDMLYMANGGRVTRVHGPFVSDREVESIVQFLKEQGEPAYIEEVTAEEEGLDGDEMVAPAGGGSGDDLYDQAVALVCRERKASTSFVQRHLQIGYNRAARLIERMEKEGVVSSANHVGKREVLARNIEAD
ncbi:DNA translocase FtsK 4TM domain-containing protein [Dongia soli]|uniref:DNA translocase FtsK n=1 Tax=Dongia soli TaxID=600628 RepID=A0ABU5E7A6_9PROT|nr:DNA translocase FtsK 4TM domain-containing protein [Dongia soli]MDY0882044.1 DNA translocase FtsK 4TM domain-containing protein [Dongia soli]